MGHVRGVWHSTLLRNGLRREGLPVRSCYRAVMTTKNIRMYLNEFGGVNTYVDYMKQIVDTHRAPSHTLGSWVWREKTCGTVDHAACPCALSFLTLTAVQAPRNSAGVTVDELICCDEFLISSLVGRNAACTDHIWMCK